jgi:predicted nucleic acid-binding protein
MATRWAYFDTSVVVKRYIQEPGSEQVRRLLRRNELLSSTLTPVEIVSALCKHRREGGLSSNALAGILRRVTSDCAGWELVEVNGTVLDRARELLQGVTPLRTLDAIVTADSRQREVAVVAGIDVISIDLV